MNHTAQGSTLRRLAVGREPSGSSSTVTPDGSRRAATIGGELAMPATRESVGRQPHQASCGWPTMSDPYNSFRPWIVSFHPLTGRNAPRNDRKLRRGQHQEFTVMSDFIDVCERAARAGGQRLMEMRGNVQVREKNPKDLVTEADFASQIAIKAVIQEAYPDHAFVGEEDAHESDGSDIDIAMNAEYCWIVDPLDGTTNYVHQLQSYSVSVALMKNGLPISGVVYDPVMDECFCSMRGGGAWLNGARISTSGCASLQRSLLAASFPANVSRGSIEVARFVEVLHRCRALRRLGSAALNLSYVAAGRLDGYWATSVKIWDVAAGFLLVEEAGGQLTDIRGGAVDFRHPRFVASSSNSLQRELIAAIQEAPELKF